MSSSFNFEALTTFLEALFNALMKLAAAIGLVEAPAEDDAADA